MLAIPRPHAWRVIGFTSALVVALGLLGGSAVPALQQKWRAVDITVQAWDWDLFSWELQAIREKLTAQFTQPQHLPAPQTPALVRAYLARAQEIAELEDQIDALYAEKSGQTTPESNLLETKLTQLRQTQSADRPEVEQILQTQIGQLLYESGLQFFGATVPPVWFTFTEPPKKLVVSPRSRIATAYYAMLDPALPAQAREEIETSIYANQGLSAYVAEIGGLGAYPTQVVDRAPLPWILSTVAHEWTHNYLTLFPLGLRYDASPELTILNETVAEIVGNEVGDLALARYYPELVKEFPGKDEPAPSRHSDQPPAFDFRKEMRQTRETVDLFLTYGRVRDAEEYMEIRRILFRENGYPIRKLNQGYFAFHGSYGTGAAASSPIGPKLERLRSLTPDVRAFLETVRGFTSAEDLDKTLATWEQRSP